MASSAFSTVDGLNLFGIGMQLVGFSVMALDLWPEYKKHRELEMIRDFKAFVDSVVKGHEENKQHIGLSWEVSKDTLEECPGFVRGLLKSEFPYGSMNSIVQSPEKIKSLKAAIDRNYEGWVIQITGRRTRRARDMGVAIIAVIFGYLLQFSAVLVGANKWLFSLLP